MNGMFRNSSITTNEEFKKVIKVRMTRMFFMFGVGCLTIAVSLIAKDNQIVNLSNHMLSVYTGMGTGLIAAAAALWIKNFFVLRNDEMLKKKRLESTDERIMENSMKAFRLAGMALLVALYGVGLIGGLFYPVLVNVLFALVSFFLLVYIIAYKVFDRTM